MSKAGSTPGRAFDGESDSDAALYSRIFESRHAVVFPWMRRAVRECGASRVLDYGAGDGRFLLELRDVFEGELWYFDPSPAAVARVKPVLEENRIAIFESSQGIPSESVDVAVSIAVWMHMESNEACIDYLRTLRRILRPGGRALIAVTHPCFREETFSSFATDFSNENYMKDGVTFSARVFDDMRSITFHDFHWNLSAMVRQAKAAGFQICSLTELGDTTGPNIGGPSRGAPWLCFDFGNE